MSANNYQLEAAGPYRIGTDGVTRIEIRTDGHGSNGYYDVIYIYTDDEDMPHKAMPAHLTDFWEYP